MELTRGNGSLLENVFDKSKTFTVHRSLKNPIKYKCNVMIGELHKVKQIMSDFDKSIHRNREKYQHSGSKSNFVNETISKKKQEKLLLFLNGRLKKEKFGSKTFVLTCKQ